MTDYDTTEVEGTEPDERDVRALTEYLTVLEDVGRAADADDLYLVVSQSGENYLVDARDGGCGCPDARYRDMQCKHARRVAFATGERPIPAGVDGVDEQLGEHTDATPQVAATDGGADVIVAGDGAEILGGDDVQEPGDDRPDDCQCWDADGDLPCWPCYRDGFEEPNPLEPAADE